MSDRQQAPCRENERLSFLSWYLLPATCYLCGACVWCLRPQELARA